MGPSTKLKGSKKGEEGRRVGTKWGRGDREGGSLLWETVTYVTSKEEGGLE